MNNEFYEHKKSDAVKWIVVFVLIGVLFAGMIASLIMSVPDKTEETEGGVTEVLRAVYPNNEVGDCSDKGYEDMYALIVTSYNGKGTIRTLKQMYEHENIVAIDYDPSATKVNQENRIKLMLATARENLNARKNTSR